VILTSPHRQCLCSLHSSHALSCFQGSLMVPLLRAAVHSRLHRRRLFLACLPLSAPRRPVVLPVPRLLFRMLQMTLTIPSGSQVQTHLTLLLNLYEAHSGPQWQDHTTTRLRWRILIFLPLRVQIPVACMFFLKWVLLFANHLIESVVLAPNGLSV
jgi:hypothetical protein